RHSLPKVPGRRRAGLRGAVATKGSTGTFGVLPSLPPSRSERSLVPGTPLREAVGGPKRPEGPSDPPLSLLPCAPPSPGPEGSRGEGDSREGLPPRSCVPAVRHSLGDAGHASRSEPLGMGIS
ncbi:MAG: hypothetical protein QXR87_04185, partial [Candidatus Hadarchaeales archaeon]